MSHPTQNTLMRYLRTLRRPAVMMAALATAAGVTVAAVTVTAVTGTAARAASAAPASGPAAGPPPCPVKPSPPGKLKPTTVTTIGQAYSCILDYYYTAPALNDQVLLTGAFAGLTQELDRLGEDQADATMPALTGNPGGDWAKFAAVYQAVTGKLPAGKPARQEVAEATMTGMVAALNGNHNSWTYPVPPPAGSHDDNAYGLGMFFSFPPSLAQSDPGAARAPLYVTAVSPGSPAARQGIRPGDVVTAVDGSAPFTDGTVSPGVMTLLNPLPPWHTVRITVRWPVTGATRTVTLTPAGFNANPPLVSSKLLAGDIGYVKLIDFTPNDGSAVEAAIAALEKKAKLRGVILDLRLNGGGSPAGVAGLVGAFEHGKPYDYGCTGAGRCTAFYPDSRTPLLHLPLAVLTSQSCLSACEAFSSAVKDLHLGTLIGTRTAGLVGAEEVGVYTLSDSSILQLTTKSLLGADHEIINGIGVAPDYYIPETAKDVATGHDPDIAKALALLGR